MEEDYNKLSEEWFQIARDNFLFAKAGFEGTGIAKDAYYLCHQAVEKYLKGYLVRHAVEPERTHDLLKVLTKCIEIDEQFSELTEQCKFLYDFYAPVRYPGGMVESFDKATAEKAIVAAEEVIDFIKKKVQYANV